MQFTTEIRINAKIKESNVLPKYKGCKTIT